MNAKLGYYTDESRKCRFSTDYVTPGEHGLAWAILLKAVEDGCSREWLRDIVLFYGIDFDVQLFDRDPANKIKFNKATKKMMGIHFPNRRQPTSALLSLNDGLHVCGLKHVAAPHLFC
jgi:hypothetical protein